MKMKPTLGSMIGAVGAVVLASAASGASAGSATFSVAGSSDPFLAAQPVRTSCCGGDTAPSESPVLVTTALTAGQVLTFSATGGVNYQGSTPASGADGDNDGTAYTYRFSMTTDYGTGIAGAQNVNVDGLVGVFVGGVPSGAAPTPLDFVGAGASTGLDFTSLAPGLDQIFWIGDGLTGIGTGAVQQFTAPTGATALYLGAVDGSGWFNNSGTLLVTVNGLASGPAGVPEPASWAMMLTGFGLAGAALRRRHAITSQV